MSRIIFMEGPDGCGKTEIGKGLANRLSIDYFKVETEAENWRKGQFMTALRFDQTYLAQLAQQCKNFQTVIDRAYPSEFVYSHIFRRETDLPTLLKVDQTFALAGAQHVICLRKNYSKNRPDPLVPKEKLQELHDDYLRFIEWTKCDVVVIYVDTYFDNFVRELDVLVPPLVNRSNNRGKTITILEGR
ncbi:MAG: hypothetical protein ACYDHY_06875 [Acidiferrobacterales bacterium]